MDMGGQQMVIECFEQGEALVEKAREWIRLNPAVWQWMLYRAAEYVSKQKHFSIAQLVEEARYTKPVKGVDEYKINNDLRAPLARMMVATHPHWDKYIEMRGSKVDGLV